MPARREDRKYNYAPRRNGDCHGDSGPDPYCLDALACGAPDWRYPGQGLDRIEARGDGTGAFKPSGYCIVSINRSCARRVRVIACTDALHVSTRPTPAVPSRSRPACCRPSCGTRAFGEFHFPMNTHATDRPRQVKLVSNAVAEMFRRATIPVATRFGGVLVM